jgi:ribosomal-protein-serine acetyltransferase
MTRMAPSARIEAPPLVLRPWELDDLEAMARAIDESIEHLRPWMPWVALEPLSLTDRAALIKGFGATWDAGESFGYGMFVDGTPVGGCGLHRRIGPRALEIGYWVHVDWTGRGLASIATAALVDAAFGLPDIDFVEIHHDKANAASRRVPENLGFVLVAEEADPVQAPADSGIECRWRVTRAEWRQSG